MKKMMNKCLGILAVSLFCITSVIAQPGTVTGTKYGRGQDSIDCIKYLSLYQQDYKHKNYEAAVVNWRKVFKNCPKSSANNVPRGIIMYQYFISKETNAAKRTALVDTLMNIYEVGNELTPKNKGKNLVLMAQDIIKYANTPENQPKILKMLEESMVLEKENTSAITYANYMKVTLEMNNEGKLSDEQLLENYTKVSDYLSAAIKKTSNEDLAKARDMIDDSFAKSPAANCENLVKIYTPKFAASATDLDFLKKLTRLLDRNECTDTELFEKASAKQFELDPSAAAAYNMAKFFLKKDNYDKAVEYYESAIEHETDPVDKANYYYQLGNIMLAKYSKYDNAKKCALEASKLRPDWGNPYILLANVYASGPKCGEDDFEKSQIYWVVVDKLMKAKAVDPDVAERVNPMIASFAKHYPKKEEAFFRNITEGTSITVGCWINEVTKARFN